MDELIYCCPWAKNRKTSWSGTHLAVYNQLSNHYNLLDFDYGNTKPFTFLSKTIFKKVFKSSYYRTLISNHYSKKLEHNFKNKKIKCFNMFNLFPNIDNAYHFIYVDLVQSYLKKISITDPLGFQASEARLKEVEYFSKKDDEILKKDNFTIFTMSHYLREFLINDKNLNPSRVIYAGGGINLKYKDIDFTRKNGLRFLFSGKAFVRKNGLLVVEAFKKVKSVFPNSELYIVGCKPDIKEDGINILGELCFEDSSKYFQLCDYFVMPSLFEAFGLVFPEALSYGLPCIGRNAFEMPYFIKEGKNGLLLNKQDSNELANLMIKLIQERDISEYTQKNRKQIYDYYSWNNIVKKMIETIDSVNLLED